MQSMKDVALKNPFLAKDVQDGKLKETLGKDNELYFVHGALDNEGIFHLLRLSNYAWVIRRCTY